MRLPVIAAMGLVLCGVASAQAEVAAAARLDESSLPTFALTTPPTDPSPWTGLYVGTEVFGVSGGKGVRGGFGGGGFAGYDRELDNGVVLGVQGNAGYAPGLFKRSGITGFNYASTDVLIGYDMGRLMPFVTAGIGLASPNVRSLGGYGGVTNAANDLFNSNGNLRAYETVGAGFAYKVTDKLTVELAVQAYHGTGGIVAP